MCGIYITNIPFTKEEIVSKLKSIDYRGPDNLGYEIIGEVSMGHLRLSILDLDERSNQPYSYKSFKIIFNGEIYNFEEIKNELISIGYNFETTSDTEVLIIGYTVWGKEILTKLNGMFAFSIYDTVNKKIFCARDRMGVKPFFYYWKEGIFEICSQLRPLINSQSKVSDEAISIYLDCGYIPSPYSILQDVYKLLPGYYMEIDLEKKTLTTSEYWNLKEVKVKNISYDQAKEELHELLKDAVKIRLQSDVPLGSFLSGGIDSALISSIASEISDKPINTFTIGFEDPKYDESKIAAKFANIIGSKHIETICGPKDALEMLPKLVKVYDEPFADSSALPSLLLNYVTKKYVTVALTGDGGDESFFGYVHFDSVKKFIFLSKISMNLRFLFSKILSLNFYENKLSNYKRVLRLKNINDFIEAIFIGYDSLQKDRKKSWLSNYFGIRCLSPDPIQKAADLNIKLWLENDSNVKVDRASMAFSVESRSPFLDFRVVEYARNLPVSFRYKNGIKKRILRDILEEYIPENIFNIPKKGFSIPLARWLREDLKDEVILELNEIFLNKVPNLDVPKFKKQLMHHMDGKYDYSFNIWKLFLLAKWYKEFKI
jgi:asparagine synthase (glutamine-hydrolysing)